MTADRRVRRLAIRGADRAQMWRAQNLIEDALRTASLPEGRPGSVLVIRRLDLGLIDLSRPSQHLSDQITALVRGLMSGAVYVESPGAETAPAVWFVDAPEQRAALATLVLRGGSTAAWWWRSVLPKNHEVLSRTELLNRLLAPPSRLARAELPGPLFFARVVEGLIARGVADDVLMALPEQSAWTRAFQARWAPTVLGVEAGVGSGPRLPEPWAPLLRARTRAWGVDAPRTRWLVMAALIARSPELVESPALPVLAAAAARRLVEGADVEGREEKVAVEQEVRRDALIPTISPEASKTEHVQKSPVAPLELASAAAAPLASPAPERPEALPQAAQPEGTAAPSAPPRPSSPPTTAAPRFIPATRRPWAGFTHEELLWAGPTEGNQRSQAGGLLFLIPILSWLGIEQTLRDEPRLALSGFSWRLILSLLHEVGLDDDPLSLVFAPGQAPASLRLEPFLAPERWWGLVGDGPLRVLSQGEQTRLVACDERDLWLARWRGEPALHVQERLQGARLAGKLHTPVLDARLQSWVAAARLALRPLMPLTELVRREAVLSATKTHVDVIFPLSGLDLNIRRAALDTDPGWVPWLGRVVAFHYVEDRVYRELRDGVK